MKTNEFLQFSLSLGLIVGLATAGLSNVHIKTRDAIAQQERKKMTDVLGFVLPNASTFAVVCAPAPIDTYWVGKNKKGGVEGAAFRVRGRGYSSDLVSVVGVDTAGKIIRMRILSESETPGLGTRVEERASRSSLWNPGKKSADGGVPWFQEQFCGLAVDKEIGIERSQEWPRMSPAMRSALISNNTISALTGATISSRAVSKSVSETGGYVLEHFRAFLSGATDTTMTEDSHASAAD